jgi:hypothetical protein
LAVVSATGIVLELSGKAIFHDLCMIILGVRPNKTRERESIPAKIKSIYDKVLRCISQLGVLITIP